MISRLEADIADLEEWMNFFPAESFDYAWRKLSVDVCSLKVKIWKALV